MVLKSLKKQARKNKMKVGVLFSGGKDSVFATYTLKNSGNEISCLLTMIPENKESYMFHTPSINKAKLQAQAMEIPIITEKTPGKKEEELEDLEKLIKKAIKKYKIQAVATGAIESVYQSSRIQKICDKLGVQCLNPLWHKNPEKYWDELLSNNFEVTVIGVASWGLKQEWLGKKIDKSSLNEIKKLQKEFNFHLGFEGGEAETFVTDCPLFKKKINILKGKKIWEGSSGVYIITKTEFIEK